MEKENKNVYYLIAIFVIGAFAGYWIKASLKDKITSGPDDRKVVAVKQSYDFDAAKQKLEKQMQEMQNAQAQDAANAPEVPAPGQGE